ncbi:MAG: ABC transporter permease [Chitinophagaceae bacterium]
MLKNYFKTTFRNLWKNKAYSFLNIFGLAIGITCAGLIFLWSENEITWDHQNVKKDRLYAVKVNYNFGDALFTMGSTPRPMAAAIRKEIPGIINTCRVQDFQERLLFNIGERSMYAEGLYADSAVFSMFTLPFVQGNAVDAFKQLYSVVITEKTAKKFFGNNQNVVGKTVRVQNQQDYIVTGVIKDLPENSSLQFEWLAPYEIMITDLKNKGFVSDATDWASYGPLTYVEVAPTANISAINRQLYNYIHTKNEKQTSHSFLFGMNKWHLYDEFENGKQTGGGQIEQVRLLSLVAWIILIIGCINFMNLATANSQKRAKEVGVRKVLGSDRKLLIFQFIGEALFMSALAACLAIVFMTLALPFFNELVQKQLSLQANLISHFIALFAIILICGLLAGSYPSLYLSSFNPISVLKGLKLKSGSAAFIRKGLVIVQFAVSVVFIICTIIIYQQILHVKSRKLGFDKENLVEMRLQEESVPKFALIREDLLHTGLVQDATISNHSILYAGDLDGRFRWMGKPENSDISISHREIDPSFFSVAGIKIMEGRNFDAGITTDKNNVIISKSFADLLGKGSAVGKIIESPRGQKDGEFKSMTVIGVTEDYVYGNMYEKSQPMIFFCQPPDWGFLSYVRTKKGVDLSKALSEIGDVVKKDNAPFPFEYKFVDDQFNAIFSNETLMSKLSTVFATLAIVISCLGLLGLAAYTAERRVKEIGIRKVLGASVQGIATLLSIEFLQLVIVACLVAFPIAWWIMHNWLQKYEYRISISPFIFIIAALLAVVVAVFTISFQAIKAAIANPVKSLRTE